MDTGNLPQNDLPLTPAGLDMRPTSVASMFLGLDEGPNGEDPQLIEVENALAQVRLGLAGSLFMALRAHHAPTARHSLRVALGVSSWAAATDLSRLQRDELEVAALLHDVGKIGVPESILRSPSSLTPDQVAIMDRARKHGADILSACCVSRNILATIEHAEAWYDGSRSGYELAGDSIPVGARMIAIVNAYDAMTTDRVYRKALPIERAMAELFQFAGTQFDPVFVNHFMKIQASDRNKLNQTTAGRWLTDLKAVDTNQFWRRQSQSTTVNDEVPFHEVHFDTSPAGGIFVRADMTIARWNPEFERMTGVRAETVEGNRWEVGLVQLRNESGRLLSAEDCPIRHSITTTTIFANPMQIKGIHGRPTHVQMQSVPVRSPDGSCLGASVIFRDMSSENTLEERVQTLHEKATRDPLTNVANRAEFDRVQAESVARCAQSSASFSLIICDIDRFKQVNDKHGHQAGDEALVSFAALLRRMCRKGDLVARYGGEEFVMVCQNCSCSEAAHLAEKIRVELSQTRLAELGGQNVTASFGVTELQPGDTAESMLRRADRGLLEAKDSGRNLVVQLGTGTNQEEPATLSNWFSGWWQQQPKTDQLLDRFLATNVPVNVAVQKLHGFVSDHNADIVSVCDNKIEIRLILNSNMRRRRRADRTTALHLAMTFHTLSSPDNRQQQTVLHVAVRSPRNRDRRHNPIEDGRTILRSLRSYLMALEIAPVKEGTPGMKPSVIKQLIQSFRTDADS